MNSVVLIGRLVKDPELRYIPATARAVCNFRLAVDRPYIGKDGQKQTDFFNIQTWGKLAENVANYTEKGKQVAVRGSIQNREYETDTGERKYITEIVADSVQFLSPARTEERTSDYFTEPKEKKKKEVSRWEPINRPAGSEEEYDYRYLEEDDTPF